MKWYVKKLVMTGAVLLGACGGDYAAVDVVTVMKPVFTTYADSKREVAQLVNTGITVLAIRCTDLSPGPNPPGTASAAVQQPVILLDMSAVDAEKAKVLGFFIYGPSEVARSGTPFGC